MSEAWRNMTAEQKAEGECEAADAVLFWELANHRLENRSELARIIGEHVDMKVDIQIRLLSERIEKALGVRP